MKDSNVNPKHKKTYFKAGHWIVEFYMNGLNFPKIAQFQFSNKDAADKFTKGL